MKASDVRASLEATEKPVCPDGTCGPKESEEETEESSCFDDEDFWEAMDMLNSSKNCMKWVLKYAPGSLTASRTRMLEELCDDIGHFQALFLDTEDE